MRWSLGEVLLYCYLVIFLTKSPVCYATYGEREEVAGAPLIYSILSVLICALMLNV